jgi:peptidoglycan/LPS O-acetylase OafA/YrhL
VIRLARFAWDRRYLAAVECEARVEVGLEHAFFNGPGFSSSGAHAVRYRPEIDGLRALAILPVVFFHYGLGPFRGGFVGVDVFFVISGYLITALIHGEIQDDRFSIARFYERRVRRIFPALFAMLAVVSVAAGFILFPYDLVRYAKSLLATAAFASNFEFWNEAGYFDVAAAGKPLLHLWSIAVEEQFYLLFPLVLLVSRRSAWLLGAVGAIFAVSFALGIWGVAHAPSATFYLLPARAWELMLGALLALGAIPPLANRMIAEVLAVLGVVSIGFAVVAFNSEMPFPGPAAFIPCAGAALVIYATSTSVTWTGKALSLRPVVFVGLISYSLYLWHWPILVLAHYLAFRNLSTFESAGLIALSFVLAVLSWQFVEKPFRARTFRVSRRTLLAGAVAAMAAAAACAMFAVSDGGFPERLRPDIRAILAEESDHEPRIDRCFGLTAQDLRDNKLCRIGGGAATPTYLLWGDSHADAIMPAVEDVASQRGRVGLFAGAASCPPLLGVDRLDVSGCRAFNDEALKIALRKNISEVILEARWGKDAEGSTYGSEPRGRIAFVDDFSTGAPEANNRAVFARGLERTVHALVAGGKKVVIVASVPEIGWAVPPVLARLRFAKNYGMPSLAKSLYLQRQSFVLGELAHLKLVYNVTIVYPDRVLCTAASCEVALNGLPIYRDEHHLTVKGAKQLEPLFEQAL